MLRGLRKTLCTPRPRRKKLWPHNRLTQTCPWESRSLRRRPPAGLGTVSATVRAWDILKEYSIIHITSTIVWPQVNNREGAQPHPPKRKLYYKIYGAYPCPSEQDPVSLSVSLSHQEASIGLLSSTKEQTDWKPHSQKTKQSDDMDHSLVLDQGNSAMLCRATQDGWIMVESSDKTWSTGEGNGKPLQILAVRTIWTVWIGKKIGHWKMKSPG